MINPIYKDEVLNLLNHSPSRQVTRQIIRFYTKISKYDKRHKAKYFPEQVIESRSKYMPHQSTKESAKYAR